MANAGRSDRNRRRYRVMDSHPMEPIRFVIRHNLALASLPIRMVESVT